MKIKTFIIDSFTSEPFKGNPAGVCLLDTEISVSTMQAIASELNLSETAFIMQDPTGDTKFFIRYFTPTVEINFCGHATLAAAKLILHRLKKEQVIFTTYHQLVITAISEGETIKMEFPLYDTVEYPHNKKLYDAFGIKEPISSRFSKELRMLIIEVKDEETLVNIQPNYEAALASTTELKGLAITCIAKSSSVYDFYSLGFWPWVGINEDPVTGAAHSVLAKYWGNKLHKTEMQAYQLSKRGGAMKLKIMNDHQLEVISNAHIVLEGRFNFINTFQPADCSLSYFLLFAFKYSGCLSLYFLRYTKICFGLSFFLNFINSSYKGLSLIKINSIVCAVKSTISFVWVFNTY